MKKLLFFMILTQVITNNQAQTVADIDGNVYNTVPIGSQVWMKENLKTTKYNDGKSIINITCSSIWDTKCNDSWINNKTGAFRYYNDSIKYKSIYGALYNWYVVKSEKLCPIGWHVPSKVEFNTLINYTGGLFLSGAKLKEKGTTHWKYPNTGATNESNFTGLPGGGVSDIFYGLGENGTWWSSTEIDGDTTKAYPLDIINQSSEASNYDTYDKNRGFSIRCLMDSKTSINNSDYIDELFIHPNPATDKLYLKNIIDGGIAIFDLQGKQVLSEQINSNSIDISKLSKGVYIVKILKSGKVLLSKLIVK